MANRRTAKKSSKKGKSQNVLLREDANLDHSLLNHLKEYARQKPEVAALWCLGVGFVLGWKLKPW